MSSGVVCHPHPLYGGTMQNKVVHTLARAMQELGAPTVRFNFRGVGAAPVRTMTGWARSMTPWSSPSGRGSAGAASACGSRGSRSAPRSRSRQRRVQRPSGSITVAPPVARLGLESMPPRPDADWLIVQGDADELVAPRTSRAGPRRMSRGPSSRCSRARSISFTAG